MTAKLLVSFRPKLSNMKSHVNVFFSPGWACTGAFERRRIILVVLGQSPRRSSGFQVSRLIGNGHHYLVSIQDRSIAETFVRSILSLKAFNMPSPRVRVRWRLLIQPPQRKLWRNRAPTVHWISKLLPSSLSQYYWLIRSAIIWPKIGRKYGGHWAKKPSESILSMNTDGQYS